MRIIRVFVSSPSDLKPEREAISRLVDEFNKDPIFRERYKFVAFLYEEMTPSFFGEIPQEVVNQTMLRASQADLVVCMFWARFGSPLKGSDLNPDNQNLPYQSGTEYEFYDAYRAYKANRKPVLTLYRCTRTPPEITAEMPSELEAKKQAQAQQRDKVDDFFRRVEGAEATLEGLYKQFRTTENLVDELRKDWRLIIARWMQEEDEAERKQKEAELAAEREARRKQAPRRVLIERVTRLIPFLIVVAILIGVIAYALSPKTPPMENQQFNVAIAGFEADKAAGISETDALSFSKTLYNSFAKQIEGVQKELPLTVGVWSPDQVGTIQGKDAKAREDAVKALVKEYSEKRGLHPNIVIYGLVTRQTDEISVQPEFYVVENEDHPDLADVFGRFKLKEAVSVRKDTTLLTSDIGLRSRVLSFITQGILMMSVPNPLYDRAAEAYSSALNIGNNGDELPGKELLFILRGNAYVGKYNKISAGSTDAGQISGLPKLRDDIQADFSSARQTNPDFARAYVGLAGAKYLSILEPVSAREAWNEIKEDDLKFIEGLYQSALAVKDSPATADIPTKVSFGLAQVQVLRHWRGDSAAWDAAQKGFQQVISDYGDGKNERVQELAAQSWGYLGLLQRGKSQYAEAKTDYAKAVKLTRLKSREQLFNRAMLQMEFDQSRAQGKIDDAVKAADAIFAMKILPRDKAAIMYHKGKMLSENSRDKDALAAYQAGVKEIDTGLLPVSEIEEKELAAQLWALIGDKLADMQQNADAIKAYKRAKDLDPKNYSQLDRVIADLSGNSAITSTPAPTLGGPANGPVDAPTLTPTAGARG